jgi:ABC-type ATPase with predicted acetyltransferase domain
MLDPITIRHDVRPATRSLATGQVADLFGLPANEPPITICENLAVDLRPGDLALLTGPSGSGKSSLLRAIGQQANAMDAGTLDLPDRPLVDALPGDLPARLDLLAAAGLADAKLFLRRPTELSDGQRYRFRLAFALSQSTGFVMLDEFTAWLDRPLAQVVAFNLRKLVGRSRVGVIAATTHDDIVGNLNPDLHLRCHAGNGVTIERRDAAKKASRGSTGSGCRTVPSPIGRTSLGGITDRIMSRLSAG